MIGKKVKVVIDRPLGSTHPGYPNLIYTVNYGYLPNLIGGDGEEQDAYVLGVNLPIEEFEGEVIAIIHREKDCENKLVVAPSNSSFTDEEILNAVNFQEKFFKIKLRR